MGKISKRLKERKVVGLLRWNVWLYCLLWEYKNIPFVLEGEGVDLSDYVLQLDSLEYHGTTSVFCEIESNPYSWIYMPSRLHQSHRIICTGNFSENNNPSGKLTATIEFTDEISLEDIHDNLSRIPLKPKYNSSLYTLFLSNSRCRYAANDKRLKNGLVKT